MEDLNIVLDIHHSISSMGDLLLNQNVKYPMYDLLGKPVNSDVRGLYIKNGRKIFMNK